MTKEQAFQTIEQKNKSVLAAKMNEFRALRKKQYASRKELIALKSCFYRYLQHNDSISKQLIHDYLDNFNTIKDSTKTVYRRFLTQLLCFIEEKPIKRKNFKSYVNLNLLEIALNSSFVDPDGVLRVKHSSVPAPFAWINMIHKYSDLDFNYSLSLKIRQDHNLDYECNYRLFEITKKSKKRRNLKECNTIKTMSIT